jgi:hypothetical protein
VLENHAFEAFFEHGDVEINQEADMGFAQAKVGE